MSDTTAPSATTAPIGDLAPPSQFKLKTETHGGHTIITELHQLTPDPAATHQHCEPLVNAEPKSAEVRQKKQDMLDKNRRQAQIIQKSRALMLNRETMQLKTVLTPDEKVAKDRLDVDWKTIGVEISETQQALGVLAGELDKARYEHRRCNPVFPMPAEGWYIDRGLMIVGPDESGAAKIMTDTELEAITVKNEAGEVVLSYSVFLPGGAVGADTIDGMVSIFLGQPEHRATGIDGTYINDYRGLVYHCKTGDVWGKRTIVALGEFPGETEIVDADITDEQRAEIDAQNEVERVAGLTAEQISAEFASKKSNLVFDAQAKENELKFDSKDTAPAQVWYDAELVALKLKYGVAA